MSQHDQGSGPEFAVAVRGYDRSQVDDYVGRLHGWLADARDRIVGAENAADAANSVIAELRAKVAAFEERAGVAAPESMNAFGQRIGHVLQAAVDAADQLCTEAGGEARRIREEAMAEREDVLAQARREAERIVRQARHEERAMASSLAELAAKRDSVLDELRRLEGHLADLLTTPQWLQLAADDAESVAAEAASGQPDASVAAVTGLGSVPQPASGLPPSSPEGEPVSGQPDGAGATVMTSEPTLIQGSADGSAGGSAASGGGADQRTLPRPA